MAATVLLGSPSSVPGLRRPEPARPEILAPAGDWECVQAAIENGADAIYFGLERFNARMRAQNFTAGDLPKLMAHLHQRGVRGYVTFNTLVFPDELAEAGDDTALVSPGGERLQHKNQCLETNPARYGDGVSPDFHHWLCRLIRSE